MSGDLLENLKNGRQRTTVPDRKDPLLSAPATGSPGTSISERSAVTADLLNTQENNSPESTSEYPGELRRFTIRVDESLSFKIDELCSRQKITPETLVEALVSECEANPDLMNRVIEDAQERYRLRKEAGVKKRAISMQKYG